MRVLLLCLVVSAIGARAEAPNTFAEEDRSLFWEGCNAPDNNMYANSWHSIHNCMPLHQMMRFTDFDPTIPEANTTGYCSETFSVFQYANLSVDCDALVEAMVDAYWCTMGVGGPTHNIDTPFFDLNVSHPILTTINQANCLGNDPAASYTALTQAINLLNAAPTSPQLNIGCAPSSGTAWFASCIAEYSALDPYWPRYVDHICTDGLAVECTNCQPYIQKDTVAQPYFFLIFPALKLIVVVLLKLFVFDKINILLREKVVLYNQNLKAPKPEFDAGFVDFIIKHLLHDARYRIRYRDTLQTLNGIRYAGKLLKMYEKGQEPTPEEIKETFRADDGILLQHATLKRVDGMTNFMNVMYPYWEQVAALPDDEKHEREKKRLATALREEEDWYWEFVCEFGRHWFTGDRKILEDYFKDVWQTHSLPSIDYHHEHTSRDTSDDVIVVFREVDFEQHQETEMEFTVECELGDEMSVVRFALGELIKERNPKQVEGHDIDRCLQIFTLEGNKVDAEFDDDLERLKVQSLKDKYNQKLTFRFVFSPHEVPSVAPCNYVALSEVVHKKRIQLHAKAHPDLVDCTRFTMESLRAETSRSLALLLDSRSKTKAARVALVMAGEETMSECNAALERYEVRDSIEPAKEIVEADEKQLEEMREARKARKKAKKESKMSEKKLRKKRDKEAAAVKAEKQEAGIMAYLSQGNNEPIDDDGAEPEAEEMAKAPKAVAQVPGNASMLIDAEVQHKLDKNKEGYITTEHIYDIYKEVFDLMTQYRRYDGKKVPGAVKVYERDLPAVQELLNELWDNIGDALVVADDDPFAVDEQQFVAIYEERLHDIATIIEIQSNKEEIFTTIANINVYILLFQIAFAIVFFGIAANDAVNQLPNDTNWNRYELIYFRFMNSGTPVSLLFAAVANLLSGKKNRATSYLYKVTDTVAFISAVLLAISPVCTHIIPACVIFIWVLLAVIIIFGIPSAILYCIYRHFETKWNKVEIYTPEEILQNRITLKKLLAAWFLWNLVTIILLNTLVFQTAFNWGLLFYRRGREDLTYTGVIEFEILARTMQCYLDQIFAENSNIMQFFSSFVG